MFRVLLIDDEELALVSLRYSLPWEEYGFTDILTTSDPLQALQYLKEKSIDAAFIDIRMPQMSGLELIDAARNSGCKTSFVIVSGYSDFHYAKEALHLGALEYCLKPISAEDTIPVLKKVADHVLQQRYLQDPEVIAELAHSLSACEAFLGRFSSETSEQISLAYVRSADLLSFVKEADSAAPEHCLFISSREAILIFNDIASPKSVESLASSAFMIICTVSDDAESFQSALKHILIEKSSNESKDSGLILLPQVSPEMAKYFSGLLNYIDSHYSEKLTLSDLASQFGINYTYLSRLFKKSTSKSFSEYLTAVRLAHACSLLTQTRMKITLIADQVGFSDYHYFCNVFKHVYSISPLQYRNNALAENGETTDEQQ